jgi:hypothetical protein
LVIVDKERSLLLGMITTGLGYVFGWDMTQTIAVAVTLAFIIDIFLL